MDTPTVTIIIPHRNLRPEMLKETLESVYSQTFKDYEIIEEVGEDLFKINNAFAKAKGAYILLLSDDDKLKEDFLEKTVAEMEKGYDIIAPCIENFGDVKETEKGIHCPGRYPFYSSLFRRSLLDTVGGYDKEIGCMADVEFWHRCMEAGARVSRIATTWYYYRKHQGQDSNTADWEGSRKALLIKHPNWIW